MKTFELSKKVYKDGKRKFKVVLHEIYPDTCIVDETGTEFNDNGVTWINEYVSQAKDTVIGMSLTCEFINDERTEIYGHGETDQIEDGIPILSNATMIGVFTDAYIGDFEINGVKKCGLIGEGTIDAFRYKAFCDKLEKQLLDNEAVFGSVEIFRTDSNDGIVYKYGHKDIGRIPMEYIYSGYALLGIRPADKSAVLLELNKKDNNKGENDMEFNEELKKIIADTITSNLSELNSQSETLKNTVEELNNCIQEKDACVQEKVEELNTVITEKNELAATVEQLQKALDDLKKEQETYWMQRDLLEKQIAEYKVKERLVELNSATAKFTEEELKYATSELNSFKENPLEHSVEDIVSKIYIGIGEASKKAEAEKYIAEQNSRKKVIPDDIYGDVNDVDPSYEDETIII